MFLCKHRARLLGCLLILNLLTLSACSTTRSGGGAAGDMADVPKVPREFRAVWVATVANIDWPSEPGLTPRQQQDEMIAILDRCKQLNFNAVVLQVRPAADALYDSDLEPWSYFLTGAMGKAPQPHYDPLAFAVHEAHRRGLELHAWFNPYRALHHTGKGDVADTHISKTHPEIVHEYGPYLWMDPAEPAVQAHSLAVMLDVVRRYDIDGVHMDDYFYPYKVKGDDGKMVDFPDGRAWQAYLDSGGKLSRSDWRRKAVDDFVKTLYKEVKKAKPHVQVGISPFGIWKPGHPEQIKGYNQYEELYADAKKWLNKGWVDYYTPQLYWEIAKPDQSFTALLGWWKSQNKKDRHLWPGVAPYRTGKQFDETEVQYQIKWTRILTPDDPGSVHFSMKVYMGDDNELAEQIHSTVYSQPALPPATPWLGRKRPAIPIAEVADIADGELTVRADTTALTEGTRWWVVQVKQAGQWTYAIQSSAESTATIDLPDPGAEIERVVVSSVSRTGIQSRLADLEVPGDDASGSDPAESGAVEAAE